MDYPFERLLKDIELKEEPVHESKPNPEMLERFDAIRQRLTASFRISDSFGEREEFIEAWRYAWSPEDRKKMIEERKLLVEVLENPMEFQEYIENAINLELNKNPVSTSSIYKLLNSYYRLCNNDRALDFACRIIEDPNIWNQQDGSTVHTLIKFIGQQGHPESVGVLVDYLNNISRGGYNRRAYRDMDLREAIGVIVRLVGREKARQIIGEVGKTNSRVASIGVDGFSSLSFEPRTGSRFDLTIERQLISDLEDEEARGGPMAEAFNLRGGYHDDHEMDDLYGPYPDNHDDTRGSEHDYLPGSNEEVVIRLSSPEVENIIRRVNSITLKEDVAPTAVGAIQLHMFNYLTAHPNSTPEEANLEYERIKRISDREKVFSDIKNPLPTIGIEIEVPSYALTGDKIAILSSLQIPNYPEGDYLWEVNPDYSYSPTVQSRMILELAKMGALPINNSTGKIREGDPLSMHVNFGMPPKIDADMLDNYEHEVLRLNDLLVYAYTSVDRIKKRKTSTSAFWRAAASSSDKAIDPEDRRPSHIVRLELRAFEFRDYPSFRMLQESQNVTAMFISHIKVKEKMPHTFVESCLADLWADFNNEAEEYLRMEEIEEDIVDNNPKALISRLENTDLGLWSRFLISDYSRKVSAIIKEALPLS